MQCTGTVTRPEPPVKEGYTFLGRYNVGTAWDFSTAITQTITLTAHWQQQATYVAAPVSTYAVRIAATVNGAATAAPSLPTVPATGRRSSPCSLVFSDNFSLLSQKRAAQPPASACQRSPCHGEVSAHTGVAILCNLTLRRSRCGLR